MSDHFGQRRRERNGLYAKFVVTKHGKPLPDRCFVLRPESDPAARDALRAYALLTDNDTLAGDLLAWVAQLDHVVAAWGG